MSVPWSFTANLNMDVYYGAGVAGPPGPPATFAAVPVQQLKPFSSAFFRSIFILHRAVIPIAIWPMPSSTDIFNGIALSVYDSNPSITQWYLVNEVSPMPYVDPFGNFIIDHWMLYFVRADY